MNELLQLAITFGFIFFIGAVCFRAGRVSAAERYKRSRRAFDIRLGHANSRIDYLERELYRSKQAAR